MKTAPPHWTPYEDGLLRQYAAVGLTDREIVEHLPGRTISACSKRRKKIGIESNHPGAAARRLGWQLSGNGMLWKPEEDVVLRRVIADGGTDRDVQAILSYRSTKSINARRMALGSYLVGKPKAEKPVRIRAYKPRPVQSPKDASILHLVDLIRSYGVQTLGEAKARYREENELNIWQGTAEHIVPTYEGPRAQSPAAWAAE
jgi:hypothetical protein